MLDFFKKEKPFQGLSGFGGGATGLSNAGGLSVGPGPTNVSGGVAYSYNGKFVHIFTGSGALTVGAPNNATFEFVVIGGGGGGGTYRGGGGGSGGWVSIEGYALGSGPHTVTVGAGGQGGVKAQGPTNGSASGGDSAFNADTVWFTGKGGGRGGDGGEAGDTGGSGGGSSWSNAATVAASQPTASNPSPSTKYGGTGGGSSSGSPKYGSGGGGGVGGNGSAGSTSKGGAGGVGRQLPTTFHGPENPLGTPGPGGEFYVGGGGGGGSIFTPVPAQVYPNGGYGGGGSAGPGSGGESVSGVVNTGGGGGGDVSGADASPTHHDGGAGGSGLVVIAYPTASSFPA